MYTIYQKLIQVQKFHDTHSCDITHTGPIIGDIFQILQGQGFFCEKKSGETSTTSSEYNINVDGCMHVVGKQGRYLLYRGCHTKTPSMILMMPPPHVDTSATNKEHMDMNEKTELEDNLSNHCYQKLSIFSCETTHNILKEFELGKTSDKILKNLVDIKVHNREIIIEMQFFSHAFQPSHIDLTPKYDAEQEVFIPMQSASDAVLPITRLGLMNARKSLRTIGSVVASKPNMNISDFTRNIVITHNQHFHMNMDIHAGVFKLCLYHTEDVFHNDTQKNMQAVPITVLSHTFHHLDKMVEEIHTDHTIHNKRPQRVRGMLKLANSLLRGNMPLAYVRKIATTPDDAMYRDMSERDIVSALAGLKLQHDDADVVRILNKAYDGVFAKQTDANELKTIQSIKSTKTPVNYTKPSVDFRLLTSGCLNYAIAHQNTSISGKLNKNWGMDYREISTALCSGISYCESGLDFNTWSFETGFINETDFSMTQRTQIKEMIHMKKHDIFEYSRSDEGWENVRHNFTTGENDHMGIITCKIMQEGWLLFQLQGMSIGVYVVPSLYRISAQALTSSNQVKIPDVIETGVKIVDIIKPVITRNHKSTNNATNRESKMKQIGNKHVGCRISLLCNATEMLYYINIIFMHNAPQENIHKLVRDAWLVTHMIYAAKICGGFNNSEFYMIYSHLQNLKSLPLDSVGYWATVPYV